MWAPGSNTELIHSACSFSWTGTRFIRWLCRTGRLLLEFLPHRVSPSPRDGEKLTVSKPPLRKSPSLQWKQEPPQWHVEDVAQVFRHRGYWLVVLLIKRHLSSLDYFLLPAGASFFNNSDIWSQRTSSVHRATVCCRYSQHLSALKLEFTSEWISVSRRLSTVDISSKLQHGTFLSIILENKFGQRSEVLSKASLMQTSVHRYALLKLLEQDSPLKTTRRHLWWCLLDW